MTRYLLDVAQWQGSLSLADVQRAGFTAVNLKVSHGLTQKSVHPDVAGWVTRARAAGLGVSSFHFLDGTATGAAQAEYAHARLTALGLVRGAVHQVDCESTATLTILREYVSTMQAKLGRKVIIYTGDWWWVPKKWNVSDLTPYVWAAPNAGYLGEYPGDLSPHWVAGYGGWPELAVMQYAVEPLRFSDGTAGTIDVSKSAIRKETIWTALTGGTAVPMNPRTHPRGAAPDFTLPRPNPNPSVMTDALWWLVCMRLALEPQSRNGGTFANKPGYHNIGNNLPDNGAGLTMTDHSIRWSFDRAGPWWKTKTAAHDWTFVDAQAGNYATITKYTKRLIDSMRSLTDLRPDAVYAYTLGQLDNDRIVEGYNERVDDDETSGDLTHLWHRHDSFRRNIVGDFGAMWKALTIDMGWTYAEWRQSVQPTVEEDEMAEGLELDKAPVRYPSTNPVNPMYTGWNTLGAARDLSHETLDKVNALSTKVDLMQRAVLAAVQGVNEEAVLAAVNARADEIAHQVEETRLGNPGQSADAIAAALLSLLGADRAAQVGAILRESPTA